MGDGHHGWAAADFLTFVRNVLVREAGENEIAVLTILPEEWRGHDVEVRNAPTHYGRASFSLRWQGDSATLEWEKSSEKSALTLPSLAPGWRTVANRGTETFHTAGHSR